MALEYWRREAIEEEVVALLQEYGITSYPLDVSKLIEKMQIPAIAYEDVSDDDQALFDLASPDAFTTNNFSFTNPKIVMKRNKTLETRMTFSLGHELGHIWLEHEEEDSLREEEANYFSGYLLAPHPLIIHYRYMESDIARSFKIGGWSADIALSQALDRLRIGPRSVLPHEHWLLKNMILEGEGSMCNT